MSLLPTDLVLPRVATGDAVAIRECLRRFSPLVWSMAKRMLRDDGRAEDATQEIFLEIWRSAERYDANLGSEHAFIATIARRRLIDHRRKLGDVPVQDLESVQVEAEDATGLTRAIVSEESDAALRAMDELKPQEKRLLRLSIMDGMSHSQIAAATELPLGTVKTHLRTGLERLRSLMGTRRSIASEEVRP